MSIRLSFDQPSVENTIPVQVHRLSSPESFHDDTQVLFAGGNGYILLVKNGHVSPELGSLNNVSVYVLDKYLLIWLGDAGVQIDYLAISMYAVGDYLMLQIENNEVIRASTEYNIELRIEEGQHTASALMGKRSSLMELFEALGVCGSLAVEDLEEMFEAADQAFEAPESEEADEHLAFDDGVADDLGPDLGLLQSGMDVALPSRIRKREDEGKDQSFKLGKYKRIE